MYKFTKGKEMEELKTYFKKGYIKEVFINWVGGGRSHELVSIEGNFVTIKHYSRDIQVHNSCVVWEETAKLFRSETEVMNENMRKAIKSTMWSAGEIAKSFKGITIGLDIANGEGYSVVSEIKKEEKVEKIVVRSWEDLKEHCCRVEEKEGDNIYIFYPLQIEIRVDSGTTLLKYAVDLLNKIFTDQNFEYKEVEVIDDHKKFHSFLEKLYSKIDDRIFYTFNYSGRNFLKFGCTHSNLLKSCSIKEIEQKYNVELKILKD